MLTKIDTTWLVLAIATVAMLSYLFSVGLHAALRDAGFGPIGNAVIVTLGFFGAIMAGNSYGIRFRELTEAVLAGLAGAFLLLLLLVIVKLALNKLM